MNRLIRNKSATNRPIVQKLLELSEIVLIADKVDKQKAFNQLITHLLLNNCVSAKCHDLCELLTQLTANLVHFQTCDQLIDRLLIEFNLNSVNDEQIETKYLELICESINLKPFKCQQILETIIIPKWSGFPELNVETEVESKEVAIFDKIHSLLSQIKIAKFETHLFRSIDRKFPFSSNPIVSIHSYVCYIYNILKTYDYISNRRKLLSLMFDKLLWIDSTIASNNKCLVSEDVFDIDDCNPLNKQIKILDHSVHLLFDFIDNKTKNKTTEENEEFFDLFKSLFSSTILTAETSNHLQYVWLYLSSVCTQFLDQFIQYLWEFGLSTENVFQSREKALYFISSLLKNANFVTTYTVMSFMNICSQRIHKYIEENDRIVEQLTTEDTIFYILCQILFDTFCAIHSDLDNLSLRRVKAMSFQRIFKCKLNPLAFCHRDIESKFLSLARHYQIGYCAQNGNSSEERLKYPLDPLNNGSYVLAKTVNKIEKLSKFSINSKNILVNEIEKFNRFNTSDESDNMIGSYRLSYSPSKTLWKNLLSDSSPNDLMDFD